MAGYSDTEITNAVTQFVQSDVEVKKDPLGPIDLDAKFQESLQFLSSTLVFDSNAFFYLVFLVTNKLNVDVQTAVAYVDDILEALDEVSKGTKVVTRTSLLGDAAAALLTLETIVTENGAISGNAFGRYRASVDAFRDASLTPNIREAGNIVRPPQKAKEDARVSLAALETLYPQILDRVEQLRGMLDEFLSLGLPAKIMQSSVQTARKDLLDLQSTFEDTSLSTDEKIAETRDAYLRITSGKSVLSNLLTISDPREPRVASTATLKGRAVDPLGDGVLVSASMLGTRSGPWDIETGVNDILNVAEDGQANTAYQLVPAAFAAVQNYVPDNYNVVGDVAAVLVGSLAGPFVIPAAPDNTFTVIVDGVTFTGSLTVGGAVPIATIVTDVQAILGLTTVVNVTNDAGRLKLEHVATGDHTLMIGTSDPVYTSVNTALGFTVGQNNTGTAANNRIQIDGLLPLIVLTLGSARTAANIVSDINTWVTANYPGDYLASVETIAPDDYVLIEKTQTGKQKIAMTAPATGVDRDRVLRAYTTLGFTEGQSDSTTSMTAAEVAKIINDVGIITAEATVTEYEEGTNGSVTGANTFTVPSGSIANPGTHVNDQLLIRTGDNADYYRIVSIVGGPFQTITVEASRPFPFTGTVDESWRIYKEVLTLTSKEDTVATELVVAAGSANTTLGILAGTYLGTTTGFRSTENGKDTSFTSEDVAVGDILRVPSQPDRTVTEITADGKQLEVSPPLSTDTSIQIEFEILSIDAVEYEQLALDLNVWDAKRAASVFAEDVQELVRVLNPILNQDGSSTLSSVGDAQTATEEFRELLFESTDINGVLGLSEYLVAYEVRAVPRIDAGLRMLTERGFDRAYDTLMLGEVASFFGFDKDDAGTGSYLLKSMRQIAQKDVPVSRSDEDADDTISDPNTYHDPDANYTFTDQDTDDNLTLIGERAVIDSDDVAGQDVSVSRSRYR